MDPQHQALPRAWTQLSLESEWDLGQSPTARLFTSREAHPKEAAEEETDFTRGHALPINSRDMAIPMRSYRPVIMLATVAVGPVLTGCMTIDPGMGQRDSTAQTGHRSFGAAVHLKEESSTLRLICRLRALSFRPLRTKLEGDVCRPVGRHGR